MNEAFHSLMDVDAEVGVDTGLRAAEKLQSLLDKRDQGDEVADMRRQVNMITDAVKSTALYAAAVGQPRHPHIEIHPVDGLDLELHMIGQDITGSARYGHHGLRFGRAASNGLPTAYAVHTPDRSDSNRVFIPSGPQPQQRHRPACPSGWGEARLVAEEYVPMAYAGAIMSM